MNSTIALGVLTRGGDSHVTMLTPAFSPGVSDDVVGLARLLIFAVADSGDGVIKVSSTLMRVDDTSGVVVEDLFVGLDGHRDYTLLNGTLEANSRVLRNISVVLNSDITSGKGSLARGLMASFGVRVIRVLSFESLTVLLQIIEGLILPSTIAAEAFGVARDQLLLGEAQKGTGSSEVSVLSCSSGGESPA